MKGNKPRAIQQQIFNLAYLHADNPTRERAKQNSNRTGSGLTTIWLEKVSTAAETSAGLEWAVTAAQPQPRIRVRACGQLSFSHRLPASAAPRRVSELLPVSWVTAAGGDYSFNRVWLDQIKNCPSKKQFWSISSTSFGWIIATLLLNLELQKEQFKVILKHNINSLNR